MAIKKFLNNALIFLGGLVLANTARGGMVSGGGELITDQYNPWFLQNTKQVFYCVEIDTTHFGVSKDIAIAAFFKGLNYWQGQLRQADQTPARRTDGYPFRLGTQDYFEVACEQPHDLTLQFGVVHDEQKKALPNLENLVAVTVRTQYDPKKLKGSGYIYISPESGPLSSFPKDSVKPNRWSGDNNLILERVMMHEVGHIMGVRHNDQMGNVMAAHFVEWIVAPSTIIESKGVDLPYFSAQAGQILERSNFSSNEFISPIKRNLTLIEFLESDSYELRMKYQVSFQDNNEDKAFFSEKNQENYLDFQPLAIWNAALKKKDYTLEISLYVTEEQEIEPFISKKYDLRLRPMLLNLYQSISFTAVGGAVTSKSKTNSNRVVQMIIEYHRGNFKISAVDSNSQYVLDDLTFSNTWNY